MTTIPKDISYGPSPDSDAFIPFEDYKRTYYNTTDGFKYEWNNGKVEKTVERLLIHT